MNDIKILKENGLIIYEKDKYVSNNYFVIFNPEKFLNNSSNGNGKSISNKINQMYSDYVDMLISNGIIKSEIDLGKKRVLDWVKLTKFIEILYRYYQRKDTHIKVYKNLNELKKDIIDNRNNDIKVKVKSRKYVWLNYDILKYVNKYFENFNIYIIKCEKKKEKLFNGYGIHNDFVLFVYRKKIIGMMYICN